MRKNFFPLRVTEPWPRLPREVVESPSLEIFQPRLDKALCSLLWVTLLGQGVGLGDPQRALPTPTILLFTLLICKGISGGAERPRPAVKLRTADASSKTSSTKPAKLRAWMVLGDGAHRAAASCHATGGRLQVQSWTHEHQGHSPGDADGCNWAVSQQTEQAPCACKRSKGLIKKLSRSFSVVLYRICWHEHVSLLC